MFETSLKMFRKLKSVSECLKTCGYDLVAIDSGSFLPKMRFLDISRFTTFWLEHAQKSKPYKLVQLVVFKKFTSAYLFQRDHFRYIQIQLGGKAQRTQTQEIE